MWLRTYLPLNLDFFFLSEIACFCRSAGGSIKSHLVTAVVYFVVCEIFQGEKV